MTSPQLKKTRQRAIKWAKRERPYEFRKKEHQEQYLFNAEVTDRVETAAKKLQKLALTDEKEKKIVEEALEELKEGVGTIAERQKHIPIADQSEYHWRTVEAYKSRGIADSEEDAKKLKQAEKSAEQEVFKERQKAAALAKSKRPPPPPPMPPLWPTAIPPSFEFGPVPTGGLPPAASRPVGPCYSCGQLGHLKLHCPKLARQQYPLHIVSSIGIIHGGYVGKDSPLTAIGYNDRDMDKGINGTVCYGDICMDGGTMVNIVSFHGSKGNIAENNLWSSCDNADPVTCMQKVDSNSNITMTISACTGCCETHTTDVLHLGTKACSVNVLGVDEPACENMKKMAPSFCEMSGVDGDVDWYTVSSQPSLGIDSMEPARELGSPEPLDLASNVALPSTFWEQGEVQVADVQGRLKKCLSFWEDELDPAPWIISCLREGYKLPLRSLPHRYCKPNQQSALDHGDFVSQALEELERNRCIIKVQEPPHVCSPLSVASNRLGKLRLVLNLRYLNKFKFLWVDKFKYEDLHTAMLMFQKDDYLFFFDLKSGYHHVDIFEPHRQFCRF